jgi:hypothetical protein
MLPARCSNDARIEQHVILQGDVGTNAANFILELPCFIANDQQDIDIRIDSRFAARPCSSRL